MPQFTVEIAYRLPVYRRRTYETATLEEACSLGVAEEGWSDGEEEVGTAGDPFVSAIWSGPAPVRGKELHVPGHFDEQLRRKVFLFDILLSRLIVLRNTPDGVALLSVDDRTRTDAVIAQALAVVRGLPDIDRVDADGSEPVEEVIAFDEDRISPPVAGPDAVS